MPPKKYNYTSCVILYSSILLYQYVFNCLKQNINQYEKNNNKYLIFFKLNFMKEFYKQSLL